MEKSSIPGEKSTVCASLHIPLTNRRNSSIMKKKRNEESSDENQFYTGLPEHRDGGAEHRGSPSAAVRTHHLYGHHGRNHERQVRRAVGRRSRGQGRIFPPYLQFLENDGLRYHLVRVLHRRGISRLRCARRTHPRGNPDLRGFRKIPVGRNSRPVF